jgi:hypothetical protein
MFYIPLLRGIHPYALPACGVTWGKLLTTIKSVTTMSSLKGGCVQVMQVISLKGNSCRWWSLGFHDITQSSTSHVFHHDFHERSFFTYLSNMIYHLVRIDPISSCETYTNNKQQTRHQSLQRLGILSIFVFFPRLVWYGNIEFSQLWHMFVE